MSESDQNSTRYVFLKKRDKFNKKKENKFQNQQTQI